MSAQVEVDKKKKAAEAREAKKKAEEEQEAILVGQLDAVEASADKDLLAVESEEAIRLSEHAPETTSRMNVLEAIGAGARARVSYKETFQVNSRALAAWVVRKLIYTKNYLEEIKESMKREVKRAERQKERREFFFHEKLLEWAKTQPRDTDTSIRMPEAGARVQFYPREIGGVEITDAALLKDALYKEFGIMGADERGLVETQHVLVEGVAKQWLSVKENREKIGEGNGFTYTDPVTVPDIKIVRT